MRKIAFLLATCLIFSQSLWASEPIWPQPPEKSRVQYLRSIAKPADIGVKKSFLRKIWEFIAGEEIEGISRPHAIAVKGDRVCVTDVAISGFHIFDLMKNEYSMITPKNIHLPSPVGAAFTKDDRLLIADSVQGKIFTFDLKGNFAGEFAPRFSFQRPTSLCVSPLDGAIWVVDTLAQAVIKFSPTGEKILSFGVRGDKRGEFNYPTGIAAGKNGNIYVCDTLNARIQLFSSAGKFISAFGKKGDSTGDFAHPKSLAIDSEKNIYVVDGLFDAVQIFNEKGQLLLVVGQRGSRNGEFYVPAAIVVDEKDRIFVSDSYNGRLQLFQYLREL